MQIIQRKPIVTAVLLAMSASAMAEDAKQTFTLDKVTVAATLTEQKVGDVANTVSVIDAEQIGKQGATDVRELFKYEPGVDIATFDRFGANSVNIRGADLNQVKIVVDGIDQVKAFNASANYYQASGRFALDMDSLKRAEVVKGPASSLYGSNAIGGVVAFTTKDPSDYLSTEGNDTAVSLKTAYHSADNEKSATFTIANRTERLETMLLVTQRNGNETENQGTVGGEGENRTEADPLDKESTNILAKIQYQLNDQNRIEFTLEDYHSESEGTRLSELSSTYTKYDGLDETDRTRASIKHTFNTENPLFDSVDSQLSFQKSKTHDFTDQIITTGYAPAYGFSVTFPFFSVSEEPRIKDYSYEEEQLQLDSLFTKSLNNHQITYGFNVERTGFVSVSNTLFENFDDDISRWSPLVEELTYGLFIQDQITLLDEKLTVTPSIRYDSYKTTTETDDAFTTELSGQKHNKTSLRLGSIYRITENVSVFGQFAQGFKTPDLDHLYHEHVNSTFGYATIGNPELKPEESDSFEVGLRYSTNLGSAEVTGFYNDYEDYIKTVDVSPHDDYPGLSVSQYNNISEATIKGIELRGSLWLDQAINAPMGTAFSMAVAYTDGEGQDEGAESTPLDTINPLKAVLGLTYDSPNNTWGGVIDWTLVASKDQKDLEDSDNFAPGGFGIVDLSAYYNVTEQLVLRANLNNLTDKKYWLYEDVKTKSSDNSAIDRYTQPGRNFTLSATYNF